MCRQIELEECIRMHDPSTATHAYEHVGLNCTYLLRNVEIDNLGWITTDYGLINERGTFLGWMSEDKDCPTNDIRPGMFSPYGHLRPIKPWRENRARARAFEKMVMFADRYGRTVG